MNRNQVIALFEILGIILFIMCISLIISNSYFTLTNSEIQFSFKIAKETNIVILTSLIGSILFPMCSMLLKKPE